MQNQAADTALALGARGLIQAKQPTVNKMEERKAQTWGTQERLDS
jgi:hypothetical protein